MRHLQPIINPKLCNAPLNIARQGKPAHHCLIGFILWLNVLSGLPALGQETYFGTNQYVEYQAGTLPVILSVPHGGQLQPNTIPDRTCPNAVTATDLYTIETALSIKQALFTLTGCYPHIVICHLKRTKLDCNRNIADGACQHPVAETAWTEYHHFLNTARKKANTLYNNQAFLIDVHGHGHPIARIELGYLLDSDELALADEKLNSNNYIDASSIRKLARQNFSGSNHAGLLRGNNALGTLLANRNYPTVPSQQIPAPAAADDYFSGGYITVRHTSYADSVANSGVQMELNYSGIRNTAANRTRFGQQFAEAITAYLSTHLQIAWTACQTASSWQESTSGPCQTKAFPNPVRGGTDLQLTNAMDRPATYHLYNVLGQAVTQGTLQPQDTAIPVPVLPAGFYLLILQNEENQRTIQIKLIIE